MAKKRMNLVQEQLKRARAKQDEPLQELRREISSFVDPDPGLKRLTRSIAKVDKALSKGPAKDPQYGQKKDRVKGGFTKRDRAALAKDKLRLAKERGRVAGARAGGLISKKANPKHRGDGAAQRGLTKGRMA